MIYVNVDDGGLGKPFWKKIRLKDVSLKNVIKIGKVVAPIGASFIPFIGGTTSGLLSKALKNKDGTSSFVGRVADSATKISKTNVGKALTAQAKSVVNGQKRPLLQTVSSLKPAGVVKNPTLSNQPVGELTPVEEVYQEAQKATKDNTMLYVLGGVGVLGAIYLVTKKS